MRAAKLLAFADDGEDDEMFGGFSVDPDMLDADEEEPAAKPAAPSKPSGAQNPCIAARAHPLRVLRAHYVLLLRCVGCHSSAIALHMIMHLSL